MVESLIGDFNPIQVLISFALLILFFLLFPRIMLYSSVSRINMSLEKLNQYKMESESLFLSKFRRNERKKAKEYLDRMKEIMIVLPTSLDPVGIVKKLEHILDVTENKMKNFINIIAGNKDDEMKANLLMAFKGVYTNHQIYMQVWHLKKLIEKTKNIQLGMFAMFLPIYEEISESAKEAVRAFVNGLPIGDSVGPFVSSLFMTKKPKEIAEDVIMTKEKYKDMNLFILKSKGPGGRLGKYGDAVKKIVEKNEIDKIITVDAGLRLEGEETGKVVEGIGVLMGGPGVEKTKIEEIATEKKIPLEGYVIKMSAPQASKVMGKKIYQGGLEAYNRIIENLNMEKLKNVLIVGVGNTVGIGNNKEDVKDLPRKLRKYWKEEKDETSAIGLMSIFPFGKFLNFGKWSEH